ncbi:MAG: DegV family protein [Eubacteriales bacterium]|nr:DegV family protein [Eubacteriales bacterium]
MKVAVATDTNSGITSAQITQPGIYLLPMPVIVDGETYFEGISITSPQLYEAMRQHKDISSSQPSPGQLMELWDQILGSGYDEIVYIPMSSGLSGSCDNALLLSQEYGGRVHVVDNHRISVTQEESVFYARRLADQGFSGARIKALLEEHAYEASIYITVDSMEYLKKGGRITPAAAAFASVLNLKPVLTIQGDRLDTYAKARGMGKAEQEMLKALKKDREQRFGDVPDHCLQVETAGTLENDQLAQKWRQKVQDEFPAMKVSYAHLPCSIACHVGMNALGIGIIRLF